MSNSVSDKYSKEFYLKQIRDIGKYIIQKADYILDDFEISSIREIKIISSIEPGAIPKVSVIKEYFPRPVGDDNEN